MARPPRLSISASMSMSYPRIAPAAMTASATTLVAMPLTESVHRSAVSVQRAEQSALPAGHWAQQTGPLPS